MKKTKRELYYAIVAETPSEHRILAVTKTAKELRDELISEYNKFQTYKEQALRGAEPQYYLGRPHYGTLKGINRVLEAVESLAYKMNYELTNPNGFWFINTIK